jgi:hypothetical protein
LFPTNPEADPMTDDEFDAKAQEIARGVFDDDWSTGHRNLVAAISTALRDAVKAERKWQPIETAPKDGTPILWHSGSEYAVIFWPVYAACFEIGIWQHVPATPIAQVVQPKLNT